MASGAALVVCALALVRPSPDRSPNAPSLATTTTAGARANSKPIRGWIVGRTVFTYVLGVAVMAIGLGAIAALDAEQDAKGANIVTFGDALWWAATTVTTVGYGDRFPITAEGRVIAIALMVVGIAMVGAVTASIAAWMVAQVQQDRSQETEPS